jgi:hypothetical protein
MDQHHRQLKDRVYRALSGKTITVETLQWFIQAFGLSHDDAKQLWSAFSGADPDQIDHVLTDLATPPNDAAAFRAINAETISLYDEHHLGADGFPTRHFTRQLIRATDDGVSRYPLRFDTATVRIRSNIGSVSELYACGAGLFAADINLPRQLRKGQTIEFAYEIDFSTRDWSSSQPPTPEYRRSALRPISDLAVTVRFDQTRVPRRIWWGTWPNLDERTVPSLREPVSLDDHSVHKELLSAQQTIVGFRWEW